MQTIVVGVDGSEAAGVALEFAVEEATIRGAELRVISVWELPTFPKPDFEPGALPQEYLGLEAQAEKIVAEAVKRVRELNPNLPCKGEAREGRPQTVLVEEAMGADLLVVGRHGKGRLASLLMGSVSRHVADHAPCPVIIVPPLEK